MSCLCFESLFFHPKICERFITKGTPSVWGYAPSPVVSPSAAKKEFFSFPVALAGCSKSRRCREGNQFSLLGRNGRERHALRLSNAVLAAQVAVGFHCERAAVFVSEPARNSRNINA